MKQTRDLLQDVRGQFSDLIQASVLKPDLAGGGDHQVAGKAGMVLSFPRNGTPSRSYSKLRLPTEGFSFDNMPFSNEKHCHQSVPHPVCSQTANVNLSFDPQGTTGCVCTPSDGLAALVRIKAATLAVLPSAGLRWDWGWTTYPRCTRCTRWLYCCSLA